MGMGLSKAARLWFGAALFLLYIACVPFAAGQVSVGNEGTFRGNRAEISITLRERGGGQINTPAMVKITHRGMPVGQATTSKGRAYFILNELGEYSIVVEATGYKPVQKDVTLNVAVTDEEEIQLTRDTAENESTGVPGKPLLAPKAKEAFDKAIKALNENKLDQAEKHLDEAVKLAPNHPDVLYMQGVLYLRQSQFPRAQAVLETATQLDPNNSRALSALGMAFVDQGKFEQAIPVLQHAEQLEPAAWDTHWTLAKAYYRSEQYDGAVKEAQEAVNGSHGSAPDAELLLAQSLTAVGRYDDAAQALRTFIKDHPKDPGAEKARRWLDRLAADGKIKP